MTLSILHYIILQCLQRLQGDRTIYSIYHLLTGKKSAQTIQDAQLFQIRHFFKIDEAFTREELEKTIDFLIKENLIKKSSEWSYILTSKGERLIESEEKNFMFLTYLDGWRFEKAQIFWMRLSLFVQVIAHLNQNNSHYYPIQKDKDVQRKIKDVLKNHRNKQKLGHELYQELVTVLTKNKWIDPTILVIRLTGTTSIGLTDDQACEWLKMEKKNYHFQFLSLLHFMMNEIYRKESHYPLLYSLVKDLFVKEKLTGTAERTYELLQRGMTVQEIARVRRLKENTILDHIVEIALQIDDFSITPFVQEGEIREILDTACRLKTKKLKLIHQSLKDVTYFQIRLVLAKYGETI